MNAFNHFASLMVATLLTGFAVGMFVPAPYSTPIALFLGCVLGWNWNKITGYKLTIGGDENER